MGSKSTNLKKLYNSCMTETYNSFDEIKDPKFRRTIEGLAKLYYDGDVNAALNHYNNIDEIMGTIFIKPSNHSSMIANLRFTNH